jgi:methylmalonyl-CoA mutase C-terminal domain/subunit
MTLFPRIIELMKQKQLNDVLVFAGGIIPEEDVAPLKKLGIKEIFGPGTPTEAVINFVKEHVAKSR